MDKNKSLKAELHHLDGSIEEESNLINKLRLIQQRLELIEELSEKAMQE